MKRLIPVLLLLAACNTPVAPPPPVTIVAADGAVTDVGPASACARLSALGCSTAQDAGACLVGFASMLAPPDYLCATTAATKVAAQACGGVGVAGCP